MSVNSVKFQLKVIGELIEEQRDYLKRLFRREEELRAELTDEIKKEAKNVEMAEKTARNE